MTMIEDSYLQRACPACGGVALDASWSLGSDPAAEQCAFAELQSSWRGFFKDRKHLFTYRRCSGCGQVYSPRYFTSEQVAELYRQMDDNTGGLPEALMARTQLGYLELLRHYAAPGPGGYLELGPDIGLFTRAAMTSAPFSHYWMIEPNRATHPTLDALLAGRPHGLLADAGEIDRVPDSSLSLAVAIHVLDHLLEPKRLLERLMPKLLPGGLILAVTHNGNSLAARAFGRRWPAWCLQHPQIYSGATLKNLLTGVGFQEVRVQRTLNYFPVTYLMRHFLFASGLGHVSLPEMPSWIIGLKLGNIAAMGRKP
jgi:hypothetical protein